MLGRRWLLNLGCVMGKLLLARLLLLIDVDLAAGIVERNRDIVLGIKARIDSRTWPEVSLD